MNTESKPKILAVAAHPVGGIRNWMRYCYRDEKFRRYDITIVAPEYELISVLREDLSACGVHVVTMGQGLPQFALRLQSTLIARKWDLVHSHGFSAAGLVALGNLWRRAPHLVTVHDVLLANQFADFKGRMRRAWIGGALHSAARIHTVGEACTKNLLENFAGLRRHPERIDCVANGIDSPAYLDAKPMDLRARFGLRANDFLIGFFGRFMSQKGFKYLIEALRMLAADSSLPLRPVIVAVGNGGFRNAEERHVESLGLKGQVIFEDFVAEPAPMMKGVDVIAMPSLWEASGLVAMEAMAAGTPLITSDCEALEDSARGTPTLVTPRGDAAGIAQALRTVLMDCAGAGKLRQQARDYGSLAALRFDARETSAGLAALYARLTAG
jgi:glycosyltransferase involved in cell wall biosynthesis